jgi:hypothetical protein
MNLFPFGLHQMSLRAALLVLQVLTIIAQIYVLYWYKTKKIHCCAECPGFRNTEGVDIEEREEKNIECHV